MSTDEERGQRAYRALRMLGKVARQAVRGGGKAAAAVATKANVVLAAIDAAVAVLDACTSVMRYQAAVEKTAQLTAKLEAERAELLTLRQELELQLQAAVRDIKLRSENNQVIAKAIQLVRNLLDDVERAREGLVSDEATDLERLRIVDFRYERALQMYRRAVNQLLEPEKETPHAPEDPQA